MLGKIGTDKALYTKKQIGKPLIPMIFPEKATLFPNCCTVTQ